MLSDFLHSSAVKSDLCSAEMPGWSCALRGQALPLLSLCVWSKQSQTELPQRTKWNTDDGSSYVCGAGTAK